MPLNHTAVLVQQLLYFVYQSSKRTTGHAHRHNRLFCSGGAFVLGCSPPCSSAAVRRCANLSCVSQGLASPRHTSMPRCTCGRAMSMSAQRQQAAYWSISRNSRAHTPRGCLYPFLCRNCKEASKQATKRASQRYSDNSQRRQTRRAHLCLSPRTRVVVVVVDDAANSHSSIR